VTDRPQILNAGCDAILPKPVALRQLLALLETHLNLAWIYAETAQADLQIVEAHAARADTSTLTGESHPSSLERGGRAYAGTFLSEGEARGRRARRTYAITEIARLASGLSPVPHSSGRSVGSCGRSRSSPWA
jgi:DNA-binding response OmpR family regulator